MSGYRLIDSVARWALRIGACALVCYLAGLTLFAFGRLIDVGPSFPIAADSRSQPSPLDTPPFSPGIVEGYWTFAGWDWEISPPRALEESSDGKEPPLPISDCVFAPDISDQDGRLIESLVALKAKRVRTNAGIRYSLVQGDFQLYVDTVARGDQTAICSGCFRYRDSSDATWREVAVRRRNLAKTSDREISLPLPDGATLSCCRVSVDGKVTAILATSLSLNGLLVETWRGLGYTVEEQPNGFVCSGSGKVFVIWSPPHWRAHEICLIQVMGDGEDLRE